jgi:hypothetical protein
LVILDIGVEVHTAHGIRIVLVRNWAVLAHTRMPGGDHTFLYNTSMVRGRAVIMHMVSSKTPAANLPQGAVIFIVVGQVLVAFEAIWEGGGRPRPLMLLTRKEANVSL